SSIKRSICAWSASSLNLIITTCLIIFPVAPDTGFYGVLSVEIGGQAHQQLALIVASEQPRVGLHSVVEALDDILVETQLALVEPLADLGEGGGEAVHVVDGEKAEDLGAAGEDLPVVVGAGLRHGGV